MSLIRVIDVTPGHTSMAVLIGREALITIQIRPDQLSPFNQPHLLSVS